MIAHKNLAPERQNRLHDIIRQHGVARVDELCTELMVSPATVRRDLELLEQDGKIRRVHGGAISVDGRLDEPLFDDKTSIAVAEKRAIADKAAETVAADDTVYLDGGSTVLELARRLAGRSDITVVTNSLRAAAELSSSEVRLIIVGGELRRRSQTIVGSLTRRILDDLHFDTAFMGTMGLSVQEGLTTTDPAEAYTKELVMQHAERVVLLTDSAKIGKVSFAKAGGLADVNTIITDRRIDPAIARRLKKQVKLVKV